MAEVLIIDPDLESQNKIQEALGEGYHCTHVTSSGEALDILSNIHFDGIIIEPSLSKGSDFNLFKELPLQLNNKNTPIFVISKSQKTSDKVQSFALGAADFISKPFDPAELQARVTAKINPNSNLFSEIKSDGLIIKTEIQKVFIEKGSDELDTKMTPIEYKIFLQLVKSKGKPLSRQAIGERIGITDVKSSRKIDAHISNLKKKLGSKSFLIGSMYRVGYVYRGS